jgi:proteic killer suppression protein
MEITFDKKYLQELYETGKTTDKKHRFQPDVVKRYQIRIKALENALGVEELFTLNSLLYKVLDGDKQGVSSIRVNSQYRIEFTVKTNEAKPVITICNVLELSNHYK